MAWPSSRPARRRLLGFQQGQPASLSYTNESFVSTRTPPPESPPEPVQPIQATVQYQAQPTRMADVKEMLVGLQSDNSTTADSHRLQQLLKQLNGASADDDGVSMDMLQQMIGQFESTEQLFGYITQLIGHIEEASTISTAPGSN